MDHLSRIRKGISSSWSILEVSRHFHAHPHEKRGVGSCLWQWCSSAALNSAHLWEMPILVVRTKWPCVSKKQQIDILSSFQLCGVHLIQRRAIIFGRFEIESRLEEIKFQFRRNIFPISMKPNKCIWKKLEAIEIEIRMASGLWDRLSLAKEQLGYLTCKGYMCRIYEISLERFWHV